MASTLTKMTGSISEFKKFLEENNNEYCQAYDILPGRDPIEGQICWQFRHIADNLYEVGGLETMLSDNNTSTDEEILYLFKCILIELERLMLLLKEKLEKPDEKLLYSSAITIQNLAAKTTSKLKEVIAAGEKDMEIGDNKVVTEQPKQSLLDNATIDAVKPTLKPEKATLKEAIEANKIIHEHDVPPGMVISKESKYLEMEILTSKDVMRFLNICENTLLKRESELKIIPDFRIGNRKRYFKDKLLKRLGKR